MKLYTLLLTLLSFTTIKSVLFTAGIWKAASSTHSIIGFGDRHIPASCTHTQQYELIKGALQIKGSHMIIEDLASTIPFYLRPLTFESKYRTPLDNLHYFCRAHGLQSTNVECRPNGILPSIFYASQVVKTYGNLKKLDNDFNNYNQQKLQEFEEDTLPLLKQMCYYPVPCDYDDFSEGLLVELSTLHQICKDRKLDNTSIVVTGALHLARVAQVIERYGYNSVCYTVNNKPTKPNDSFTYDDIKELIPVDVLAIYEHAQNHLSLPKVSPHHSSDLALNAMYYRAFAEKNRFLRFAHKTVKVSVKGTFIIGMAYLGSSALTYALLTYEKNNNAK